MSKAAAVALLLAAASALAGCATGAQEGVLRLGYFPNLTHGQALLGVHDGHFQEALGPTKLVARPFNAGPSAVEALLAGRIDVTYVGPSPTISALAAAGDDDLRIIAGGSSGGVSFVVRPGLDMAPSADWSGKRFASPQLGNTQDLALKHFLRERGLRTSDQGGSVTVVNAANADILVMFAQDQLDGAWVPEPWASRLVLEAGGEVAFREESLWPEGRFVTTHIVTTRQFLASHGEDVENLLRAHVALTQRLANATAADAEALNDAIETATGKRLAQATLEQALRNLEFTHDTLAASFLRQFEMAKDLGFVDGAAPDPAVVYDVRLLERAALPPAPDAARAPRLPRSGRLPVPA